MSWRPWHVAWTRPSQRDMRRLQPQVARRVRDAIERYAHSGHGDVVKLEGAGDEYRLRVGDWRVRLEYDDDIRTVIVLRVLPVGERSASRNVLYGSTWWTAIVAIVEPAADVIAGLDEPHDRDASVLHARMDEETT